jgi:hypothetical protein
MKIIVEKEVQIQNLSKTINELKENIEVLNSKLNDNKGIIEDLEFQLEEHKLGVNEQKTELESSLQSSSNPDYLNQATEGILNQLKIEQEISKNHLEEIKFLKEQLEIKENDIKEFKLNENNFQVEREKYRKSLNEIEETAKQNCSNEISELNEKIRDFERKNEQNKTSLEDALRQSESKRSEIQFLFDELNIKFNDQESVISKKYKELVDSLEFTVEEQKVQLNDLQVLNEKNLEEFNRKIKEIDENRDEESKKINANLVNF